MASEEENQGQHMVECDMCQTPVSFFCRRCGVNLCDSCLPKHVRIKSKNGHDVVDYASKDDDDDTCFCDSHPKNECSAYCKTCNVPICMLCVSIKHKSHEMLELSDKIEELLKVITKENERFKSLKLELERILDHTMKVFSSISSIYKQKKDEVTARGEEWHKLIKNTVKKLHQELDDMQKEHEALLQKQGTEYGDMIKILDEITRKATSLQKSHDVKEMQTFIPVIEKLEIPEVLTQYSFPTFYECEIDASYLQTYFGFIEKIAPQKIPFFKKMIKKNEYCIKRILKIPTVTAVIYTGFPAHEESGSRLYDMAVTDDKKVWVGGKSKELKLFDLQGNLHRIVRTTMDGYHLCMYNNQVVYSGYKALKMISYNETEMTLFTTGVWESTGITSTASGDLLVCLHKNDQSKVVRYSSTGTVLQEIQYDSQCQPLYTHPYYITENVNGDIILSDLKKHAVIAVNKLGIFRYTYSGNNSNFLANTIATDIFGHVIISDFMGIKIHMLDRDGRFMRYIIPEGDIKYPRGVCILGNGEMIVGECKTGLAKIIKYLEEEKISGSNV